MLGGGVPHCPWWGGLRGVHGVCPLDDPLLAGGRSRSGYHVVVAALEDCNPDLRWGVATVCRGGGEVVVRGAEAGGAEGGVAVRARWPVPTAPGGSGPLGGPSLLGPAVGRRSSDA